MSCRRRGLARTTAIHSAFLTGLVVVFVPLLCFVPRLRCQGRSGRGGRRWRGRGGVCGSVSAYDAWWVDAGSLAGSAGLGDLLTLGCALAFAGHLLSLSRLAGAAGAELVPLQIMVVRR